MNDGQKIRLEEKGGPAKHGGPNGTLNVTISIRPDSRIERTFNQVSDNTQEIKHKIQSIRGLISRASVILGLILLIISGTFYVNSCNTYNSIIDQVGIARKAAINSMTTSSPILDDALSDNSKGDKWDTNKNCFFTNGTYSVTQAPADALTQPAPHTTCTAEATNFSNFVYQVTLTIVQGNCGGISFRTQQNNTDYYVLEVCQDGSYRVARFSDGNENDLISFTSSPAIRTGINRPNTIAVIANGRAFVMKVNYQEVTSVSDGSYSDGKIGVFAEAHTKQTMVAFNNAEVWNL